MEGEENVSDGKYELFERMNDQVKHEIKDLVVNSKFNVYLVSINHTFYSLRNIVDLITPIVHALLTCLLNNLCCSLLSVKENYCNINNMPVLFNYQK